MNSYIFFKNFFQQVVLFVVTVLIFISCKQTKTIKPQRKNIVETVYASGKILSGNEYNVYVLGNGTVIQKLVKEGDTVSKDKLLYVISNDAPSARLEAAKSVLSNAQQNASDRSAILNDLKLSMQSVQTKFQNDSANYARLKNLYDQNVGTKSALDNAYTNYVIALNQKKSAQQKYDATLNDLKVALNNAKSLTANAQSDYKNYFISSEVDGTVFQTFKEVGEAVRANEIVALIGASNKRILRLSVDQQDIDKIRAGEEILVRLDVTGNTIYHAKVSRIYPVMNEADQTFRVDADFTDSLSHPFIHSSAEANIIVQKKNNALIIPRIALISTDSVIIKDGRKIKTIYIKTGIHTLDEVEILQGVDETTDIILPSEK